MLVKGLGVLFIFVLGYVAEVGREYPDWTLGERYIFLFGTFVEVIVVIAMVVFILKLWRSVN